MLLLISNIEFHFYLTFCGDVLVVYLVTLVVYIFVDIVAALVDAENSGIISMINRTVVVVPNKTRAAIISSE